jgi:hypothetical protein
MTKRKQKRQARKKPHVADRFHELLAEIGCLHDAKNLDYAGGCRQGPLGNFDRVSTLLQLYPVSASWSTPAGVALAYMLKQLDAALVIFTTGKESVTGEGLAERLRDVATYAIILLELIGRYDTKEVSK